MVLHLKAFLRDQKMGGRYSGNTALVPTLIIVVLFLCTVSSELDKNEPHENIVQVLKLLESRAYNLTVPYLHEQFTLQVYGGREYENIPYAGTYYGRNALHELFSNISRVCIKEHHEITNYKFFYGENHTTMVRLEESHRTRYKGYKLSLIEFMYIEVNPAGLLSYAQINGDTDTIGRVLFKDSGKLDPEVYYIWGSVCVGILLGVTFGSTSVLIWRSLKKRIKRDMALKNSLLTNG